LFGVVWPFFFPLGWNYIGVVHHFVTWGTFVLVLDRSVVRWGRCLVCVYFRWPGVMTAHVGLTRMVALPG
jgi:hypothetical protein